MKKRYKKKGNAISRWLLTIVGLITAIGIGGLFINGTFTSVVILNWLPLIVHQVVGWVTIASAFLGFVLSLMK